MGDLDQSSRDKSVRTGQGLIQIGSGIWMKFLSKSTARDFICGVQSIMKVKCLSVLSPNGATKLRPRNSSRKQCESMDHPRLSRQIDCRLIRPRFVSLELQIANYVVVDQTTGVKIRTCRFDDESVRCSALKALRRYKSLPAIMRRYTTILIMRDI